MHVFAYETIGSHINKFFKFVYKEVVEYFYNTEKFKDRFRC